MPDAAVPSSAPGVLEAAQERVLEAGSVPRLVRFVLFSENDLQAYRRALGGLPG